MPSPPPAMTKPIQAARLFAVLSDPTRLALLVILRSGSSRSIARLSANAGMSRQAVAKHLRVLADAGFVTATLVGRETHYVFNAGSLAPARTALDAIAGDWSALDRRMPDKLP